MIRAHSLGHACWLLEAGALRLLFDPLLFDRHHGDVFAVYPPRNILREDLAADVVFVTHRHPDHFDVKSLAWLANSDPDIVVVTPDALVAKTCRTLGFTTVREVLGQTVVHLDGQVAFATTSSEGQPDEWGVFVTDGEVTVWNQVDAVFDGPADVRTRVASCCAALSAKHVDLALIRWQPLREVQALIGEAMGFPARTYDLILREIAAIDAHALAPTAAGVVHAPPYDGMNHLVYPVTPAMLRRDLAERLPSTPLLESSCLEVKTNGTTGMASELVTPRQLPGPLPGQMKDPRVFSPTSLSPIVDPTQNLRSPEQVREILVPYLDHLAKKLDAYSRATFELVLVGLDRTRLILIHDGAWTETSAATEPAALVDVRNVIAESYLCDVLEARRAFGDVLLAGLLRAVVTSLRGHRLPLIFLYEALSYEESFARRVGVEVEEALRARGSATTQTS